MENKRLHFCKKKTLNIFQKKKTHNNKRGGKENVRAS